jgi:ferredoxin-NADP reductase
MKFISRVIELIKRNDDVLSIRFERPKIFDYLPGQYMFLTLDKHGKKLRKHFTFSSSPTEEGFIEITKRLTGHEYSNALTEQKGLQGMSILTLSQSWRPEKLFQLMHLTGTLPLRENMIRSSS